MLIQEFLETTRDQLVEITEYLFKEFNRVLKIFNKDYKCSMINVNPIMEDMEIAFDEKSEFTIFSMRDLAGLVKIFPFLIWNKTLTLDEHNSIIGKTYTIIIKKEFINEFEDILTQTDDAIKLLLKLR